MKLERAIATCAIGCVLLAGTAYPAIAGKKKKARVQEVVEVTYQLQLGVAPPGVGDKTACLEGAPIASCLTAIPADARAGKYVKVEVADASGQKVAGFLSQGDADGDGLSEGFGDFCGATPEPVALLKPGEPVDISLAAGACEDGTPSLVTQGTVTLTFSSAP